MLCLGLPCTYADASTAYTLTATLTGTTVTVAWTAPAGHSTTDWVALYTPGAVDTDYNASGASYRYLSATSSGTLTFTAPQRQAPTRPASSPTTPTPKSPPARRSR